MTVPRTLAPTARPAPALRCVRLSPADWAAGGANGAIGAMGWGVDATGLAGLDVPVLSPQGPRIDAWLGTGEWRAGRSGAVSWQADAHWAFGHIDLPGADADLAETTRRAYRDLFAALQDCGRPRLLRVWNYLPRINADGGGLERYRQFNIGRQQAFIEAGQDAFEGAPAACALGTQGGGLSIRFLAGREPPRPLDNPRQVPAYRYSPAFGPRSPSFSRAALADAGGGQLVLFISGTASIVGESSVHPGDVRAQVRETLANLQAVLDAAHAQCTARFALPALSCSVYVRNAADAATVREVFEAAAGPLPEAVYLQLDICRSELLVEIEGHAFAAGVLR